MLADDYRLVADTGTKQAKLAMECAILPAFHLALAGAAFYSLARGSPVAFCFHSSDMFHSATNAHWDPFVGASELLSLVFGEAFSILNDSEYCELDTPPGSPISSQADDISFGHPLLTKINARGDITLRSLPKIPRGFLPLPNERLGNKPGPFRDFLGVPEKSDPDFQVLWQLKEKYRVLLPSSHTLSTQADSGFPSAQLVSSVDALQASSGLKDVNDGKQKAVVGGWEPSEGESLPLVNITFDSSILRPAQSANNHSRPSYGEPTEILGRPPHRVDGSNVKKGSSGNSSTNASTGVASLAGDGNVTSARPEPSRLHSSTGDLAERRIQGSANKAFAIPAGRPLTAQASRPLSRVISLTLPSTAEKSSNMSAANPVRKLHTLVPPQLARSITKNTLKAREDESIRLRLQQQESTGYLKNAMQSNGMVNVYRTGSVDNALFHRQSLEANRGAHPSQAPPNGSRPYSTPAITSTQPAARPENLRQPGVHAPLAVAHQVPVSLPAIEPQNVKSGPNLSNHESILSVASQLTEKYKGQEQAQTLGAGLTGALSRSIGFHFDSATKENTPVHVMRQTSGGQLKVQPLGTSNMANTQAFQPSSTSEALRTLKRAWSDAEVGHLERSGQKKLRLL